MGFTVKDRYLLLLTLTMLYVAKKESHGLTAAKCVVYNISRTSVKKTIKYDLQLKCILVHCGHPLPGGHLIMLVLPFFSIRVFSPINIPSFLR